MEREFGGYSEKIEARDDKVRKRNIEEYETIIDSIFRSNYAFGRNSGGGRGQADSGKEDYKCGEQPEK